MRRFVMRKDVYIDVFLSLKNWNSLVNLMRYYIEYSSDVRQISSCVIMFSMLNIDINFSIVKQ